MATKQGMAGMTPTQHTVMAALGLAGAIFTPACKLDLDADLVKESPGDGDGDGDDGEMGGPSCPRGFICTPEEHAGRDGGDSDSGSEFDGSADAGGTAACSGEFACQADSYCSNQVCMPICSDKLGCALGADLFGPFKLGGLFADDQEVYVHKRTEYDSLNNSLDDGQIWRLGPDAVNAVVTGLGEVEFLAAADGKVYFRKEVDGGIFRASADVEPELVTLSSGLDAARQVVVSDGYVWFGGHEEFTDPYFEMDLWRAPRPAGTLLEKVKVVRGTHLLAATDNMVAISESGELTAIDTDDLSGAEPTQVTSNGTSRGFLTGKHFVGLYPGSAVGIRLDNKANKTLAALQQWLVLDSPVTGSVVGEWLVWSGIDQASQGPLTTVRLRVGRSHAELKVPPETLLDLSLEFALDDSSSAFTLLQEGTQAVVSPWSEEVVYYHPLEQRLFRRPIPRFSCEHSIPCQAGSSCQPNQTCRPD
jgi:hypothetical protein